jgi:hypothetical protein
MKVSRRTIIFFALGLTLTTIGLLGAQTKAPRPTVIPPVSYDLPTGRFQIVNPVPSEVHDTMLLDTSTGKTWIMCKDGEVRGWCNMFKN